MNMSLITPRNLRNRKLMRAIIDYVDAIVVVVVVVAVAAGWLKLSFRSFFWAFLFMVGWQERGRVPRGT